VIVANATEAGTAVLTDLQPFTQYVVQVEACTRFGCTRSEMIAGRTLEGGQFMQLLLEQLPNQCIDTCTVVCT